MNPSIQQQFMYLFERVGEPLYFGPRGQNNTYYNVPIDTLVTHALTYYAKYAYMFLTVQYYASGLKNATCCHGVSSEYVLDRFQHFRQDSKIATQPHSHRFGLPQEHTLLLLYSQAPKRRL